MKTELFNTLKENWMMLLVAVAVFGLIAFIFPLTTMGKGAIEARFQYNAGKAIYYNSLGMLTPEEKQVFIDKYGMTEEDFDPLGRYLEEHK